MKKYFIPVLIAIVLFSFIFVGFKDTPTIMSFSPQYTGDQLIYTGSGLLWGVIVSKDGVNSVTTFDIYDNTEASGTVMIPTTYFPTNGNDYSSSIGFGLAIPFVNGIYIDLTCAGTVKYIVYYYAF